MSDSKANLLVVDDTALVRMSLSAILSESGYRVRTAHDGFSALTEIRREVPDLIVSDLNMPRMSGFELLSVVRRRFPAIRVIAMSGSFSGEGVPPGVAADAFYEKGSDPGLPPADRGSHDESQPGSSIRIARARWRPIWIPRNGHDQYWRTIRYRHLHGVPEDVSAGSRQTLSGITKRNASTAPIRFIMLSSSRRILHSGFRAEAWRRVAQPSWRAELWRLKPRQRLCPDAKGTYQARAGSQRTSAITNESRA